MNFEFLGHNCFKFRDENTILLTDPWFSKQGAFFGSWYQYPPNSHLFQDIVEETNLNYNFYVYISHDHQDHFDSDSLEKLNKNIQVIIPKFKDFYFKNKIKDMGFKFKELADEEELKLNNAFTIKMFVSDIGGHSDSAILIKTREFNFFNQNDCKIFDRLRDIKEKITYYSVQFSGANWHPTCFEFDKNKKSIITKTKVENKLLNVINAIKILDPKYYLPSAGPAIFPFLDKNLSFGKENIFIHQDFLNERLKQSNINNAIFLKPGELFDENKKIPIRAPNINELKQLKKHVTDVWQNINLKLSKSKLISKIQRRLYLIRGIQLSNIPLIIFNWGKGTENKIIIDLNNKQIIKKIDLEMPFIEVKAEEKYFALMHEKERWGDLVLSMRASVKRKPDIFNNVVNVFLSSDENNLKNSLQGLFEISQEKCIVKNSKGVCFKINRFCPHQGADLKFAQIDEENNLICPRHGWKFCLNKKGIHKQSKMMIHSMKISNI